MALFGKKKQGEERLAPPPPPAPPPAREAPSLAAWPTVPTVSFARTVEVVGESFYVEAFTTVLRGRRPPVDGVAVLLPEPSNPYDSAAVAVWLDGAKVGHLSRDDCGALRPRIDEAIAAHGVAAVSARLAGHEGAYAVVLDFALMDRMNRHAVEEALVTAGFENYHDDRHGFGISREDYGFSVWNGGDDDDVARDMAKALRAAGFAAKAGPRPGRGGSHVRVTGLA